MDLQNGIAGRIPDVDGFIATLVRARDAARAKGFTIGYVRVAVTAEESESIPASSRFHGAFERLDADAPGTDVPGAVSSASLIKELSIFLPIPGSKSAIGDKVFRFIVFVGSILQKFAGFHRGRYLPVVPCVDEAS